MISLLKQGQIATISIEIRNSKLKEGVMIGQWSVFPKYERGKVGPDSTLLFIRAKRAFDKGDVYRANLARGTGPSRAGSRDTTTDLKELHVSFCRRRCLQPAGRDAEISLMVRERISCPLPICLRLFVRFESGNCGVHLWAFSIAAWRSSANTDFSEPCLIVEGMDRRTRE